LAQIAQARKQLGADAAGVDAYFVTVDPARDTPERLREYTANFAGTVGLTGTPGQLAAAYAAFGVVAQRRDAPDRPTDYFMDHTAHTFLVDPAGRLRLVYPYPAEPADIAADVRALAAAKTIKVTDPWVRATKGSTTGPAVTAAYFTIENGARQSDTLLGATSDAADQVEVHRSTLQGGVMRMGPAGELEIPTGGKLTFAPGGLHVMLTGLRRDLPAGAEVVLRLRFARAGDVVVRAVARG
jgi:copper(I)-binding protein